jgi:DNA-binding helix-hairpin-helix protein with protein kinase domain
MVRDKMTASELGVALSLVASKADLGRPTYAGRQADVFELNDGSGLLFKRYKPTASANLDVLARLLAWPATLNSGERQSLGERVAWPLQVVMDAERPVGVTMRVAPNGYFHTNPADATVMPRSLDWLYVDEQSRLTISLVDRVKIAAHIASTLDLLHRTGLNHGDISDENILWDPKSKSTFLLDCDGCAFGHVHAISPRPKGSPGWLDPAGDSSSAQSRDFSWLCSCGA